MKSAVILSKESGTHKPLVGGSLVLSVAEGNPPATTIHNVFEWFNYWEQASSWFYSIPENCT